MELLTGYVLPCVYAFVACIGFSVIYNIHGFGMVICAGGGSLGWLVYLLAAHLFQADILRILAAAMAVAVYAEVMARIRKCPVTSYLLVGIFPLVPGGGIYYAMEHAINGETAEFISTLMNTLGLAGSLAVGALLVSSAVRALNLRRLGRQK